jgi:hypothetical protein
MPMPNNKQNVKVCRDGRIMLSGSAYQKMKAKLRELAENKCERCSKFTLQGDVEHITIRGMGAAKRDDRIFVDGKRNLLYLCRVCHTGRHIPDKVIPAKQTDAEFEAMLGLSAEDCQ